MKKPRRKRFVPEELFEDYSTREWNRHRKVVETKLTPEQRRELRRLVDQARRED